MKFITLKMFLNNKSILYNICVNILIIKNYFYLIKNRKLILNLIYKLYGI